MFQCISQGFPLDQFEIDLSFIILCYFFIFNFDVYLLYICVIFFFFLSYVFIKNSLVISNFILKLINFLVDVLIKQFFYVFEYIFIIGVLIFIFILIGNLFGLFPGSFCLTAQFNTTFFLSTMVFWGIVILSILYRGVYFFLHFIPKNVPSFLKGFLTLIEITSYMSRWFSLAIRLFANMVSGHSLLYILNDSNVNSGRSFYSIDVFFIFLLIFPTSLIFVILGLELGIAFLQAYVFLVLFLIYIKEIELI